MKLAEPPHIRWARRRAGFWYFDDRTRDVRSSRDTIHPSVQYKTIGFEITAIRQRPPDRHRTPAVFSSAFKTVAVLAFSVSPVETAIALGWRLRGKRVRCWNQLLQIAVRNPRYYDRWVAEEEPRRIARYIASCSASQKAPAPIVFLVLSPPDKTASVAATIASIRAAFGNNAEVLVTTPGPFHAKVIDPAIGLAGMLSNLGQSHDDGWLIPVLAGDRISRFAGRVLATALPKASECPLVFWDEDTWDGTERSDPWCKPSWDPLLFLARDTISGAGAIHMALAKSLSATELDESLTPAAIARLMTIAALDAVAAAPRHLPFILTHRSAADGFVPPSMRAAMLADCRKNAIGDIRISPGSPWLKVSPIAPGAWPGVSILIPTRDHADLLEVCLQGIRDTSYPGRVETIVIDNGSIDQAALELLARVGATGEAQVLGAPGPFNYASLINRAAAHARMPLLCLLNNDVAMPDRTWLTRLARHVLGDAIGAVGPRLLYPDGTIQHAGVVVGLGGAAGHIARGLPAGTLDQASWHGVTRQVSAVTGACLLVRRECFDHVGGFDEDAFPVAFNDVDFCLKLVAAGWRILYVADATLIHHESKSRGTDLSPEKAARFAKERDHLQRRWNTATAIDPRFSPALSRVNEQCLLAFEDDAARSIAADSAVSDQA